MPKRELAIFIIIDVVLAIAVIVAAFHHLPILAILVAFAVLSVVNGVFIIVALVRKQNIKS
jgi:hypothetical protein